MAIGLLGRKVGMTQIFDESGNVVPVTVIEAGPCHVLQLRTKERDGYEAVQLGFRDKPRRLASRSQRGHVAKLDSKRSKARAKAGVEALSKAGCEPQRFIREFRGSVEGLSVGQTLDVTQFAEVKRVDIVGITKGRGTAGVMVRHNFQGQRASHGVKKVHRHAGSIGQSQFPGHVPKGRRMGWPAMATEPQHDAQREGGARRRREQPAAGLRRRAGPQRRLRDDQGNEQTLGKTLRLQAVPAY